MRVLTEIFTTLLRISLLGSGLILFVLILRGVIGKKLPGKLAYGLWVLVLIRLVFPLQISSGLSVENQLPVVFEAFADETIETNAIDTDIITYGSLNKEIYDYPTPFDQVMEILTYVWVFGIFVVMFFPIISYVTLKRAIEEDENAVGLQYGSIDAEARRLAGTRRIRIKYSYYLDAPALIGVFRPIILLPTFMKDADEETLLNVLLHEMVHYKHFHLILQWAFWLVKAIHWFNPLVWIAHEWMKLDGEFACDDEVIELLGQDHKNTYGHILIDLSEGSEKSPYAINAAGLINRDSELKRRIARIGRGKKSSKILSILTLVAVCLMIPLFFTVQTSATEEVKEIFVSKNLKAEPQEDTGIIIDVIAYNFDSTTSELKVDIDYKIDGEIQQFIDHTDDFYMYFYLSFPKSYDSTIRENNIEETGFNIMAGLIDETSETDRYSGEQELVFKIEDYDREKFGDPVLFYSGSELYVKSNFGVILDEDSIGEAYIVDDFLTVDILNVGLGENDQASVSYEMSNAASLGNMNLDDRFELKNAQGEYISTSGSGENLSNNLVTYEIHTRDNQDPIASIDFEVDGYYIEFGRTYARMYGEYDGLLRWDLSLESEAE